MARQNHLVCQHLDIISPQALEQSQDINPKVKYAHSN